MPSDLLILAATAVLAVVALIAAVISVRNLREIKKTLAAPQPEVAVSLETSASTTPQREPEVLAPIGLDGEPALAASSVNNTIIHVETPVTASQELVPHHGQVARVVDGEVVVTPTRAQVANAIMGQPRVRFAIWMTGLAHALRPESRDRISGMMRRDYRERRRYREQAARHAIRTAHSPSTRADEWAGS